MLAFSAFEFKKRKIQFKNLKGIFLLKIDTSEITFIKVGKLLDSRVVVYISI